MKLIIRTFVAVLVLTGAVATTQTSFASSQNKVVAALKHRTAQARARGQAAGTTRAVEVKFAINDNATGSTICPGGEPSAPIPRFGPELDITSFPGTRVARAASDSLT